MSQLVLQIDQHIVGRLVHMDSDAPVTAPRTANAAPGRHRRRRRQRKLQAALVHSGGCSSRSGGLCHIVLVIEVVLGVHVMRTAVPVQHDDLANVDLAQVEVVLAHPALGGRMAIDERLVTELVFGGGVGQLFGEEESVVWRVSKE